MLLLQVRFIRLEFDLIPIFMIAPSQNGANIWLDLDQVKIRIGARIFRYRYSRVHISSDTAFLKILKKPSIVQE